MKDNNKSHPPLPRIKNNNIQIIKLLMKYSENHNIILDLNEKK